MSLPELQQNPLVQRVIDIFDTDGNGEVDFQGKLLIERTVSLLCSDISCLFLRLFSLSVYTEDLNTV